MPQYTLNPNKLCWIEYRLMLVISREFSRMSQVKQVKMQAKYRLILQNI
jgi:hypothetical protein